MELIYNETTGEWEEKKEPYAVIECVTEEDYNKVIDAIEKQKAKKPVDDDSDSIKTSLRPTMKRAARNWRLSIWQP